MIQARLSSASKVETSKRHAMRKGLPHSGPYIKETYLPGQGGGPAGGPVIPPVCTTSTDGFIAYCAVLRGGDNAANLVASVRATGPPGVISPPPATNRLHRP